MYDMMYVCMYVLCGGETQLLLLSREGKKKKMLLGYGGVWIEKDVLLKKKNESCDVYV